ncbi:hypothetical protein J6590_108847 [Homalodisca vitripennis]|nr:hypothetical protein J6590_108847 [Homalodisca vitripennis]
MIRTLSLALLVGVVTASSKECDKVDPIDRSLKDNYCDQPLFVTFAPKTEEITLIDNICYTYFPLPDDPNTYQLYISRVYCDGSTDINSYIITDIELGVFRGASPYCTFTDSVFGYAGCDTYLIYRCMLYGDCEMYDESVSPVFGLSPLCRPLGLSCLRKVEEIVRDNCLPEQDYYALPMKLPNKCVTSQICVNSPPFQLAEPVPVVERSVAVVERPLPVVERPVPVIERGVPIVERGYQRFIH